MSRTPSQRRKAPSLPLNQPKLLHWFRNSATIAVARVTSVAGFATAVVGGLDWSPLLGMSGLDRKQLIAMGVIVLFIGISHEIARRRTLNA